MISQIDKKLEDLILKDTISDEDIQEFLGVIPNNKKDLLEIFRNVYKILRTYGRKSSSLEEYMNNLKKHI